MSTELQRIVVAAVGLAVLGFLTWYARDPVLVMCLTLAAIAAIAWCAGRGRSR